MKRVRIVVHEKDDLEQAEICNREPERFEVRGGIRKENVIAWRDDEDGMVSLYLVSGHVMNVIMTVEEAREWLD